MGICSKEKNSNKICSKIKTDLKIKSSTKTKGKNVLIPYSPQPPIPFYFLEKSRKFICKVKKNADNGCRYGTGFFMEIKKSKKYLVTNNHIIIQQGKLVKDVNLQLFNDINIKLNLRDREIKYFPDNDIALIEIKESNGMFDSIDYLHYDLNYKYGYNIYKDADVCSIFYDKSGGCSCSVGRIIDINDFQFKHNVSLSIDLTISPIIMYNKNNIMPVIGIHLGSIPEENINYGILIGEIVKEFEQNIKPRKQIKDESKKCLVLFKSTDQLINCPISGYINDDFKDFEEKLFKNFPDLRYKNIFFLANGSKVDKNKTLEDNKIKNDVTILIVINED